MTSHRRVPAKALATLVLVASATTAAVAMIVAVRRLSLRDGASIPTALSVGSPAVVVAAREPIAAEADVFRTGSGMLAIDPASRAHRAAHPRTLATFRSLRAYPGAPPRIPHGLTPAETRTGGCTTCHERGGYSQRFGAYVPITPHPEMGACLQCHVGDAQLMSNPLPGMDPSARCRQCHAPGSGRWRDSSLSWTSLPWPQLSGRSGAAAPQPIPHTLELRGNCLACHSAPAGVAEIRTSHPERANCRQCHIEKNATVDEFVRTPIRTASRTGGSP